MYLYYSMKQLFIIALLLISGTLVAQQSAAKINWMTWDQAIEANKKEPKKIFIDIYTNWCGWCKRMDATTFKNPVIVDYFNKYYYAIKMNAEMKDTIVFANHTFTNPKPNYKGRRGSPHTLAASLLNNKLSYPSFVIMNEKVERIHIIAGYQKPQQLEPMLSYIAQDKHVDNTPYNDFMATFKSKLPKPAPKPTPQGSH